MKKYIKWSLIASLSMVILFVLGSNLWIVYANGSKVYRDMGNVPPNEVALVLGTSNKLTNGNPNPFFQHRIHTAALLYHQKKVKHFILSGDNRTKFYNEPIAMKKALMAKNVPESAITLDYAGFRTLDSIVRCKEVFGQAKVTIITQPFHSFRALFISRFYDVDAIVMTTEEIAMRRSLSVKMREYLARPKAVWDLYIADVKPKFLGKKEYINSSL